MKPKLISSGQAVSWWEALSDDEHDVLIELLYYTDLEEEVEIDEDGNYVGLKPTRSG